MPPLDAQAELASASDFVLASGFVEFTRAELAGMHAAGEVRLVPPGEDLARLWPRVWSLMDEGDDISDGTDVCWIASQCGAGQLTAAAQSETAAVAQRYAATSLAVCVRVRAKLAASAFSENRLRASVS